MEGPPAPGECVLLDAGSAALPYVALVVGTRPKRRGRAASIKVRWFYRPTDVQGGSTRLPAGTAPNEVRRLALPAAIG